MFTSYEIEHLLGLLHVQSRNLLVNAIRPSQSVSSTSRVKHLWNKNIQEYIIFEMNMYKIYFYFYSLSNTV
jgi:hypothetical protein